LIYSDEECWNKRIVTGSTHGIVGESVLPKCEQDIPCIHYDKNGSLVGKVLITEVSHLPEGNFNLFSLTKLQKNRWTLFGNADYIKLQKGGNSLLFNIIINTPKGALYVGKFSRKGGDEMMGGTAHKAPTYNINKAHKFLGHNNKNDRRQMASQLGWTITKGSLGICESCANAKAKQKNVPTVSTGEKATVINGRWFHDDSTLKVHKGETGTSKIWDLTVDELTGLPFTEVYNRKNEFIENMCQCIQAQKARGYPVLRTMLGKTRSLNKGCKVLTGNYK
jgi:hypothetical protein